MQTHECTAGVNRQRYGAYVLLDKSCALLQEKGGGNEAVAEGMFNALE